LIATAVVAGAAFRLMRTALARHCEAHAPAPGSVGANAAVATANPLATEAAARVLEEGGSAVDAAIAAALMLGVVDPYNSGLGGGGFALVYEKAFGRVRSFDFRERAPAALDTGTVQAAVRSDGPASSRSMILTASFPSPASPLLPPTARGAASTRTRVTS
jgi:gamma-glutamyltranspeptidase